MRLEIENEGQFIILIIKIIIKAGFMITKRQEELLTVLVKEYIQSPEPVASYDLLPKLKFKFSSATIRNEMKVLEEKGYLCKSHTSSGRIPLKKAYKFYIDKLIEGRIRLPEDADKIKHDIFCSKNELENFLRHAGKILSDLTRCTSVILGPSLNKSIIKYLKLIKLSSNSVMIVLVNNIGMVVNKIINFHHSIEDYNLEKLTNILNERLYFPRGFGLRDDILREFSQKDVADNLINEAEILIKKLKTSFAKRIFCEGTFNLLDAATAKDLDEIKFIFEVLKEEKFIAQVMSAPVGNCGINAFIGNEFLPYDAGFSLIMASYSIKDETAGTMGIIGPIIMPYDRVISVLKFTAEKLGQKLEKIYGSGIKL